MKGARTRRTIIQADTSNIYIASIINPLMFRANDSFEDSHMLGATDRSQEGTNIIIFAVGIKFDIYAPCRTARADMSIRIIDS